MLLVTWSFRETPEKHHQTWSFRENTATTQILFIKNNLKEKKKQKKKKKVGMKKKKEKSALRGEVLGGQYGPPTVHRCCKSLNPHLSSSQGAVDPHTHTRMALFDPVTFYRIASRIKWAWYNDLVYEVRRLPGKKTMQLPLSNCLWVLIQEWVNVKL